MDSCVREEAKANSRQRDCSRLTTRRVGVPSLAPGGDGEELMARSEIDVTIKPNKTILCSRLCGANFPRYNELHSLSRYSSSIANG